MAQRIYTSDGVVLRKEGVGETSLSALILTKDFGLMRVRAQGARKLSGKLRHALEPMTFGNYSFVSGRYGARLVGAHAHEHLLPQTLHAARAPISNIARLCVRLLPGEEVHKELFDGLLRGLRFLKGATPENVKAAECAIVLGLLRKLGYLPDDPELVRFAEEEPTAELLSELQKAESRAVRTINQALLASGL